MASSIAMISNAAGYSCISGSPNCVGGRRLGASTSPLSTSSSSARLTLVRCSTDKESKNPVAEVTSNVKESASKNSVAEATPSLSSVKESIDRSTKKELTRADIERHQSETTSEKQSVLGTRPVSTTPWPRPELERRPETGDRSLGSLFAIDGAAPETINGRMAMVGFVWAFVAEKMTGLTVMEQLFNPATSGALWFGAVVQLFTLASIIPFVNGESTDARRWGPFNAKAERWNGRLAMIGFASLVIDEMIRQGPIFH